jgi:hypothetical protein
LVAAVWTLPQWEGQARPFGAHAQRTAIASAALDLTFVGGFRLAAIP